MVRQKEKELSNKGNEKRKTPFSVSKSIHWREERINMRCQKNTREVKKERGGASSE